MKLLLTISKPYPRKGTETSQRNITKNRILHNISKPYPRKGTETIGTFLLSKKQ